jgi:glycosyltransferase involved in cell wall biosynthesis
MSLCGPGQDDHAIRSQFIPAFRGRDFPRTDGEVTLPWHGTQRSGMFSIVIPTHNGALTLIHQLDALAQQDYSDPWEVLVADNGSEDDTQSLVENYTGLPALRWIDASARRGEAAARNIGTAQARGDIILCLDDDDIVGPDWLSQMGLAFHGADIIGGGVSFDFEHRMLQPVGGALAQFLPHGLGANLGVRRTVLDALGGFDEDFYAATDLDLCWRGQIAGFSFAHHPAAVVYKRRRDGNLGAWKQHFSYGRADVMLYRRFAEHGMKREWLLAAKRVLWLATRVPVSWTRSVRPTWIRTAGHAAGRLFGSIQYRNIYP